MKDITVRLEGVGLLLLSNKSKLLVLRELAAKPIIQKRKGMLTIPLETIERNESRSQALSRLLVEEVGIVKIYDLYQLRSFEFIHPDCKVNIHAFVARVDKEFIADPADDDVIHHGWMTPDQLIAHQHKRIEVDPIVRAYFEHF
jgi:ADP-ribose pyrophosphatase YjhB (NUDIX family)